MKYVGSRIKIRRTMLQMSQAALAIKCECTCRTIQAWERGDSLPGCEAVFLLCIALNCSADWLLGLATYQDETDSFRSDSASSSKSNASCKLSDACSM